MIFLAEFGLMIAKLFLGQCLDKHALEGIDDQSSRRVDITGGLTRDHHRSSQAQMI